jgi:sialate O-acetylesterase
MIAPYLGLNIKGIIWYQGESNRHEPQLYQKLFPAMVASWRNLWHLDHQLPFYYVQIAPLQIKDTGRSGLALRMAQLNCLTNIPNSGMVCTLDLGRDSSIHPPDKKEISERLMNLALHDNYNFSDIVCYGPAYKFMKHQNNKLILSFANSENGMVSAFGEFKLFEIAGSDKIFKPARAKIVDVSSLEVWSDDVTDPQFVRYAWKEYVKAELFNKEGLPAPSFTTEVK